MNEYEVMYILDPRLEEEYVDKIVEKHSIQIKEGEGEILKVDKWGKRKLAYELKGHKEGYYVVLDFLSPKEVAQELSRQMRLSDEVLRVLLVKASSGKG